MKQFFAESVYDSLQGHLVSPVPGVEDAFAPGSPCDQHYGRILKAYQRLCARLGQQEEDPDVEIIMDSFFMIMRELGLKMYGYGAKFGNIPEKTEKND